MPRQGKVSVPPDTVTAVSDGAIAGDFTFAVTGGYALILLGTADSTAPALADFEDGLPFKSGDGYAGTLAELFPGASFTHLWALSEAGTAVSIYHG